MALKGETLPTALALFLARRGPSLMIGAPDLDVIRPQPMTWRPSESGASALSRLISQDAVRLLQGTHGRRNQLAGSR